MDFRRLVACLCLAVPGMAANAAHAEDRAQILVNEENDRFASHDDRHYTQGIRFSYTTKTLAPEDPSNRPYDWLARTGLPVFSGDGRRRVEFEAGQSMFTPADTAAYNAPTNDHPYGGWLYVGANLIEEKHGTGLENFEVLAGVVGPAAMAHQTQNLVHGFLDVGLSHGWGNQLRNEPGLVISYERKWRFEQPLANGFAVDAIPEAGATLGNVFTYGSAGGLVRFGHNLGADYGPSHIRPSLSGTGWFDPDQDLAAYVFAGVQGRLMGRNIFLDGNTWENSASVEKKPFVADMVLGASLAWSSLARLDFTYQQRTKEFYGQAAQDKVGLISLAIRY